METILYAYAIRHNPTGGYLPVPKGRAGRGGSFVEPFVFKNGFAQQQIRFFHTEQAAKSALGMWLKGEFHCYRRKDDYWEEIETTIIPVPTRKREEMEIVKIEIKLPSPR